MPADPLQIRLAARSDLPIPPSVDPFASDPQRAALIARAVDDGRCSLAIRQDSIAAYMVLVEHWFGHRFVELIVVAEPHRRRGIATALLRLAAATAPTTKLYTSTNRSNGPMRRLLEREGFCPSGIIENLDEGDPELVYMLPIAPSTAG